LNFDSGFAFGMSTSISSPFGLPHEQNPAVRFVNVHAAADPADAAGPGGSANT
jgi:hypothetical protein